MNGLGTSYEILKIDKKPLSLLPHHPPRHRRSVNAAGQGGWNRWSAFLVETYEVGVLQCGSQGYPSSAVEAKFSIPYTVAAALVREMYLAEFAPEVIGDPLIQSLANRVQVNRRSAVYRPLPGPLGLPRSPD